jgi:hypothetical protein
MNEIDIIRWFAVVKKQQFYYNFKSLFLLDFFTLLDKPSFCWYTISINNKEKEKEKLNDKKVWQRFSDYYRKL